MSLTGRVKSPANNRRALAALIVAIVLLPIGVGAALVEHRDKVADENRALRHEARSQSEVLNNYFARARSLTQLLSYDASFRRFYASPASRSQDLKAANASSRAPSSTCFQEASARRASSTAAEPRTRAP